MCLAFSLVLAASEAAVSHQLSVAFGGGAGAELVDVDGHYTTRGELLHVRAGYDRDLAPWLSLGAVATYQRILTDEPLQSVLPGARVRAHLASGAFEAGVTLRLTGLLVALRNVKTSLRDEYTTHAWYGAALGLALDARYWIGDLAFELSPDLVVGRAWDPHGNGWYLDRDCTHLSVGLSLGAVLRL